MDYVLTRMIRCNEKLLSKAMAGSNSQRNPLMKLGKPTGGVSSERAMKTIWRQGGVVGGAMAGPIKGILLGPAWLSTFHSGKERRDSGSKIDLTLQDGTTPTSCNR